MQMTLILLFRYGMIKYSKAIKLYIVVVCHFKKDLTSHDRCIYCNHIPFCNVLSLFTSTTKWVFSCSLKWRT